MVSLAITEKCPGGPPDTAESLRDNALWFPDIPEPHWQLNEASFTGIFNPASGFASLFYALFRDATNPQPLTKISVVWQTYMATINFHYATGDVVKMGRDGADGDNDSIITSFDIYSTGGEVIEKMKTSRIKRDDGLCGEAGMLRSFKVSAYFLEMVLLISCSHSLMSCPKLTPYSFLLIDEGISFFGRSSQRWVHL
jgi:hypothetical protein